MSKDNNSGNCNSGIRNSGDYNSGYFNSGFFNTDEPTVRLFNKDTNLKRSELNIPYIYLKVTEWIPTDKMTDEQKKIDPNFYTNQGTLIKRTYEEAWSELTEDVKKRFLDLPNFDADIFKEITGIDVTKVVKSCDGKIVEIDGKKYKLTEV